MGSSAEAEYYALTRGASRSLGIRSLMIDMGMGSPPIVLQTDSSGAVGIAGRRGCGKIRHLQTQTLWLQELILRHDVTVAKISGKVNEADVGTKHLPTARSYTTAIQQLRCRIHQEPHPLALRAAITMP